MFNVPPAYVCKTCLLFAAAAAAFLLAARGSFDPFFKNRGIIKLSSHLKSERHSGKRGGETTEERRQLKGSKSVNHCPASHPVVTCANRPTQAALHLEPSRLSCWRSTRSTRQTLDWSPAFKSVFPRLLQIHWGVSSFFCFGFFMCELESIAGVW